MNLALIKAKMQADPYVFEQRDRAWLVEKVEAYEAVRFGAGCRCDPPGSGEEYCVGTCVLRQELATAQSHQHSETADPITPDDDACTCWQSGYASGLAVNY